MDKKKDFLKLPDKIFGIEAAFLRLFIVPFLVLLGFLVSFNLVISPKFSELSQINQSVKSIDQQIDSITQKINYLTSVDQQQIKNDANPTIKKVIARRFKLLKTSELFQSMKIINPAQEVNPMRTRLMD